MKLKKKLIISIAGILLLGATGEIFASHQNIDTEARVKINKKKSSHRNRRNQHRNKHGFRKRGKAKKTRARKSRKAGTKSKKAIKHKLPQLTDSEVVGIWVNHVNKDIHQQITFHANHTWNENQHHVNNIYHGTWKIVGKNRINLQPWDEDIVFTPGNYKRMTVVSFSHVLTKNN